jgi:hypothetical protein
MAAKSIMEEEVPKLEGTVVARRRFEGLPPAMGLAVAIAVEKLD